MDLTADFEAERPRLLRLAARILADEAEAQDVVQTTWLRLHGTDREIDNLPGWLTTVTARLCLDRLRARVPIPHGDSPPDAPAGSCAAADPVDEVVLADTIGVALHVVLERLSPAERVAFVLHDTFGFDFATVATVLGRTPAATRKLASRARSKVSQSSPVDEVADWQVVDAFLDAARGGDLARLLDLLAPDVVVWGDDAAVALGTPKRLADRDPVAAFFNGAAASALPVFVGERPGAAWFDRGVARVVFDFRIRGGVVHEIAFRAEAPVLAELRRRRGGLPR